MPSKTYYVCEDFKVDISVGWLYTEYEFKVDISLPAGSRITSARMYARAHGQTYFFWGTPYFWRFHVDLNGNRVIESGNRNTCEVVELEQDVTPYIVPREGEATETNIIRLRCDNVGILSWSSQTYTIWIVVDYEGEEPSFSPVAPPTGVGGEASDWVRAMATFLNMLPTVMILYLVMSIISMIREFMPREERGKNEG